MAVGNDRTPTLSEVARVAGVSLSTASKAINGRADVAERTRRRILEVAEQLSFTPNPMARGLLTNRTSTVGILTSDLEGRFVLPILMGAEDAFGAGKVSVFLCDARGDAIREQHHLKALLSRRVDGIIVVGRQTDPRPSIGREFPIPVVYAYAPSVNPADTSLTPDNATGGRIVVEHLLACGRSRIAHITGDRSYAAARDRVVGIEEALSAAGLGLVGDPMYSEWTERWGRNATAVLLQQHADVDAVICGSDQIARGVIDTLRDAGRTVPDDVAVISFDNWQVLATNARPELTTVDFNLEHLGKTAARYLLTAMGERKLEPGVHRLPVSLVIRGSTIPQR